MVQKTKVVVVEHEHERHADYSPDIVNVVEEEKHWEKVDENIKEEKDDDLSSGFHTVKNNLQL